jgi:hypothetical protein
VLEHCGEGETNCWPSICRGVSLVTASLRRRNMSMYVYLFIVAIYVNYTRELRVVLKLPTYVYACMAWTGKIYFFFFVGVCFAGVKQLACGAGCVLLSGVSCKNIWICTSFAKYYHDVMFN